MSHAQDKTSVPASTPVSGPSNAASSMTPPGTIEPAGDRASLIFRRILPHPPEKVWRALTEPGELEKWFMTSAQVEPHVGGRVELVGGPAQFRWTGSVLTWEPCRVFEYEWILAPRPEVPQGENTVVRWELEAVDGGTLLTLFHRNLTRPTALGFAPGTHAYLDRLEALLAGTILPNWTVRYGEVAGAYPSWSRRG